MQPAAHGGCVFYYSIDGRNPRGVGHDARSGQDRVAGSVAQIRRSLAKVSLSARMVGPVGLPGLTWTSVCRPCRDGSSAVVSRINMTVRAKRRAAAVAFSRSG